MCTCNSITQSRSLFIVCVICALLDKTAQHTPAVQLPAPRLMHMALQVVLLTFGENFPDASESWLFQIYSILMGLLGVVGFALLLALTEQIILEVLESNVRQGTKVFERDHVLVLAQCVGGKDMETLWRMLNQARFAHLGRCNCQHLLPPWLHAPTHASLSTVGAV